MSAANTLQIVYEAVDQASQVVERLEKVQDKLTDEINDQAKANRKLNESNKQVNRSQKQVANSAKESQLTLGSLVKKIGLVAAAMVAARKAYDGLVFALQARAEIETLETSFVSLTGSVQGAKDIVEELNDFTASTPFQLDGVGNAARQLITAKGNTEGLQDELRILGDISAVSGVAIIDLAQIYAKSMNKGKLQAEELNQLSERGVPIMRTLADILGVNTNEVFKLASEGQIGFNLLRQAMERMTSEG